MHQPFSSPGIFVRSPRKRARFLDDDSLYSTVVELPTRLSVSRHVRPFPAEVCTRNASLGTACGGALVLCIKPTSSPPIPHTSSWLSFQVLV